MHRCLGWPLGTGCPVKFVCASSNDSVLVQHAVGDGTGQGHHPLQVIPDIERGNDDACH